jgi:hypothetical protein
MNEIKPGYTRISTISNAYAGYGGIPKGILDKASCRGTQVHRLIQSHTNNIVITDEEMMFMDQSLAGYFASFKQYWKPYEGCEIVLQEERIDDPFLMVTGEPDLVIMNNGKMKLIDWKATAKAGKHWEIQAGGYGYLLREIKDLCMEEIDFVRLDKDGGAPEVISYSHHDQQTFLDAYRLYKKFMENNKCNLEDE